MTRCLAIGAWAAFTLVVALPVPARAAAKPGTAGVIEVEYEMVSQSERKRGIEYQIEWRGKRLLKIVFEVVAGDLQPRPVTLVGAPKGKTSFAARTDAVAKRNEKGKKDLDAAIKQCRKDRDCEVRVTMEFMNSPAGAQALQDSMAIAREAAGKGGASRYQLWSPAGAPGKARALSGSYVIEQYSRSRVYDPLCGKTRNICTEVRETKGAGPLTPEGLEILGRFLGTEGMLTAGVVVDTAEKLVTLGIPRPDALVEVTEVVQSDTEGTKRTTRKEPWLAQAQTWEDGLGAADLPYVEPMTELRGEQTKKVVKGYAPTVAIRWRFSVKP